MGMFKFLKLRTHSQDGFTAHFHSVPSEKLLVGLLPTIRPFQRRIKHQSEGAKNTQQFSSICGLALNEYFKIFILGK